jgi:hypothetical protein
VNGSVIRKALLLAWIALLLIGGAGIDVAERCAAAAARACCCKAAVAKDRIEFKRACGCGCRVEPKAPAPERPASRAEPVRDPALRPAGDLVAIGPVPMQLFGADLATPAQPCTGPPRFVLYCVWRI